MIGYRKYENYIKSEHAWLEAIPSHWSLKKNKYVFTEKKDIVGENSGDYVLLSLTLQGIIPRDMENPSGKFPAEFNTYKIVNPNDIVFCLFDVEETPRTVGHSSHNGMITGAYTVVECSEDVLSRYIYYYYLYLDIDKRLGSLYTGLRKVITSNNFFNIKTPLPSIPEQQVIADFLDRKTAQIDTLIEKKQRQIDLLQEQRTALINHAVTKGQSKTNIFVGRSLAPWLFSLPTGWKRQPLKYNSYMKGRIGYQNLRSEEYTEEGPYLVSSTHFRDGVIEWDKCNHVTKERFEMAPEIILQRDDVLFMKDGALMGKLAYVGDLPGEACLNSHLLLMRPLNGSYLPRFLYYVFTTDIFEAYMIQERTGTTFFGLSQESMGNFPISLPPIDEQKEICKYLDEQNQKIKSSIDSIYDGIFALQEYRTALISEAVTGKIDVRTAV